MIALSKLVRGEAEWSTADARRSPVDDDACMAALHSLGKDGINAAVTLSGLLHSSPPRTQLAAIATALGWAQRVLESSPDPVLAGAVNLFHFPADSLDELRQRAASAFDAFSLAFQDGDANPPPPALVGLLLLDLVGNKPAPGTLAIATEAYFLDHLADCWPDDLRMEDLTAGLLADLRQLMASSAQATEAA